MTVASPERLQPDSRAPALDPRGSAALELLARAMRQPHYHVAHSIAAYFLRLVDTEGYEVVGPEEIVFADSDPSNPAGQIAAAVRCATSKYRRSRVRVHQIGNMALWSTEVSPARTVHGMTIVVPNHAESGMVMLTINRSTTQAEPLDYELRSPRSPKVPGVLRLTARQREVLLQTSVHGTAKATAIAMRCAERTVNLHLQDAMRALDCSSKTAAVAKAIRLGLI